MSIRSPSEIRSNSGCIRDADLLPTGRDGKRLLPAARRISGTRRASPAEPRSARNGLRVPDDLTLLSDQDLYLFNEGTHLRLWEKLGAHPVDGGVYFAVWAPNAEHVSVIGDFNDWNPARHPLRPRERSGIWESVVPAVAPGTRYKYPTPSRSGGTRIDTAHP